MAADRSDLVNVPHYRLAGTKHLSNQELAEQLIGESIDKFSLGPIAIAEKRNPWFQWNLNNIRLFVKDTLIPSVFDLELLEVIKEAEKKSNANAFNFKCGKNVLLRVPSKLWWWKIFWDNTFQKKEMALYREQLNRDLKDILEISEDCDYTIKRAKWYSFKNFGYYIEWSIKGSISPEAIQNVKRRLRAKDL